jgi:hypothetical protein
MQPFEFESMAQALLEQTYRIGGNLVQFGAGKDGGREATWSQPTGHPNYSRPCNQQEDVVKEWVFQVKYHDIDQRGWSIARDAVIDDLEKELDKIINIHKVPCHAYVMITNVPFTGVRNVGTRDKVTTIASKWKKIIPEIYVWDSADLSRMLDANEDVRTAYLDTILVGDTLKALFSQVSSRLNRKQSAFRAYLKFITEREESARSEEAGDDPNLSLTDVFIDLTLKIRDKEKSFIKCLTRESKSRPNASLALLPEDLTKVRASFALFFGDHDYTLLLGGPGLGKSTLTQFLSLYQAARIVNTDLCQRLIQRLKLPECITTKDLDAYCRPRFPFRIELRRYAKWISDQENDRYELARYIVDGLINPNSSSTLEMEDIFELAATNPILLILDGLDEVPNSETRRKIIENLTVFLRRIKSEDGDIQVILSSRPKGYSSEFDGFEPITWELNELERTDFDEYCECWINNRIRDVDERNEAKERINRGMMSEAVQRLARSLLQATVILTIVRRKIEIPHQRNSLYKKYVEVIFDREKEKSLIVRQRETELLRLHERVGYELHCKMEKEKIESLDRETFRGYVLNVLEDYSASKLENKTFRDIANEIIEAATDRLCLLVGKGEDQTDVDFVVQQYREYFAAVYLSNHPDAVPELVFDTLVRRGAYWSYVLQFYVAQANTNQQIRWVTCIPEQGDEEEPVETIIRKTRTYRAILNVLPEFTQYRKNDFERTLNTIFRLETRWTYLDQESAISILRFIPYIDVFQVFWRIFGDLSLDDKATLAVEIWLLAQLSDPSSEYYEELCKKIQNLLSEDKTQATALLSSFQNDLQIDLTDCSTSKVKIAFENHFYRELRKQPYDKQNQFHNLVSCQTDTKKCELLLSISNRWWWNNARFPLLTQSLEKNIFPEVEFSILKDRLRLRILPYLCRGLDKLKDTRALTLWSKKLEEIDSLHARYLNILAQAIQDPTNHDLDNEARILENQIADEISYTWKSEYVLGPAALDFSSIEAWKLFKQRIIDISNDDPKWISKSIDFNKSLGLGICLFFHPDHWGLLVEEKIITEKEFDELIDTPLGNILKIPSHPLDIFYGISFFSDTQSEIDLYKVLLIVLNILEKEGIDRISKAKGLDALMLYRRKMTPSSLENTENLLNKANNLPPLPSVWMWSILRLCLNTPELSIDILLDFWEKNEHTKPHFPLIHEEELSEKLNQLLGRILGSNRSSALRLAMIIASCSKPNKSNQDYLRERLIDESTNYLNSDEASYATYCSALLNLQPSLEEFSLWVNPEYISHLEKSSWFLETLSKRFLKASDSKSNLDYEELRKLLSFFIDKRLDYPPTIALGALEAILKIDENNLPTLVDKMWKQ